MEKKPINPCTRCGTERIVAKVWDEQIQGFGGTMQTVTFRETVCPNKDCQVIVEKELQKQQEKRDKTKKEREQRALDQKTMNMRNRKKVE